MGCSVTIRGFQLIAHLALRGQGQALLRNRGSADIPARVPGTRGQTRNVRIRVTSLSGMPEGCEGTRARSPPVGLRGGVSLDGSESSRVDDVM
jgi:hypothetical protein